MNFDVFVNFCDGILQNVLFKNEKTSEEKNDLDQNLEGDKKDDELYDMIIANLNNPDASIYEDKQLLVRRLMKLERLLRK